MQNPCQDSYYTLFSSYPMLLNYHEEQAKNSRWIRCKVADLQVEPLGESSPLIGNLPAFAAGTSQEAVKDTAENLGLAMRVNGELYPVRMTAYKSLLDRAKIGGTALPKLSREVLAEVLNECLKLYTWQTNLLFRPVNGRRRQPSALHCVTPASVCSLLWQVMSLKILPRMS